MAPENFGDQFFGVVESVVETTIDPLRYRPFRRHHPFKYIVSLALMVLPLLLCLKSVKAVELGQKVEEPMNPVFLARTQLAL